jgi:hypothetical protein
MTALAALVDSESPVHLLFKCATPLFRDVEAALVLALQRSSAAGAATFCVAASAKVLHVFEGQKLLRAIRFPSAIVDAGLGQTKEQLCTVACRDGALYAVPASVLPDSASNNVVIKVPSSWQFATHHGVKLIAACDDGRLVAAGLLQAPACLTSDGHSTPLPAADGQPPTALAVVHLAAAHKSSSTGCISLPATTMQALFTSEYSLISSTPAPVESVLLLGDSTGNVRWYRSVLTCFVSLI